MTYRNDLDAAHARVDVLERELVAEREQRRQLEAEVEAARRANRDGDEERAETTLRIPKRLVLQYGERDPDKSWLDRFADWMIDRFGSDFARGFFKLVAVLYFIGALFLLFLMLYLPQACIEGRW